MIKNSVFLQQIQLFKTSLFFLSTFSLIKREKKRNGNWKANLQQPKNGT